MAKFIMDLPNEEIKKFAELGAGTEKMLGKMTEAGAKVVYRNTKNNMKKVFKNSAELENHLVVTRTYKTPSDGGINTKVGIYGYMEDGTPAPLVANAREFGTVVNGKKREAKKPFLRPAFNKKNEIEDAMLEAQQKEIEKIWGLE